MPFDFTFLPTLNAILNATCTVLLVCGVIFVKRNNITAHRACMIAAVSVSALFLMSYLVYHYHVGSVPFTTHGWIRPVYFTILLSHTVLAVVALPLVLRALYLGLQDRLPQHRRVVKWAFPIWIYVSVTGVVVYLMLYRL